MHLVNVAQAAEGEEFHPPGPADFEFPPLFGEGTFFTKPMLIIVLGTLLIAGLFWLAARRASLVPAKAQFLGEGVYGFVRNSIVGDSIGREGRPFVAYLTTLFCFIAVLNVAGIIPVLQLPATSKIAIPLFLALISWAIFNYVGIKRHGFLGYFKAMMFPPGLPKPIYVLLAPLEFFSTVIIRPVTLTLRLTLNMFAGHLVLLLTVLGRGVPPGREGRRARGAQRRTLRLLDHPDLLRGVRAGAPGLRVRPALRALHRRCARRRALITTS